MVAGLVTNHELHALARPTSPSLLAVRCQASSSQRPGRRIVVTPTAAYLDVLRTGRSVNLGGNVHDLLIARTCRDDGLPPTTLDRRQSTLAAQRTGLDTTLLRPAE